MRRLRLLAVALLVVAASTRVEGAVPVLVRDINVTPAAANGSSSPGGFTVSGSFAFFVAADAAHGRELWRTDGTTAGTQLVYDVNPGPADFNTSVNSRTILGSAGGYLYFSAD